MRSGSHWLRCPDKCCANSTRYFVGDLVGIEVGVHEKSAGIVEAVGPGHLNTCLLEAGVLEESDEFRVAKRACDASDPQFHAAFHVGRQRALDNDIGDREPSTWLEYAECFRKHFRFVA